ncbi:TIGR04255 family protein [Kocuria turfanensis]|nr:TIGR04255 family protein [Kocuria turfanensis]
MTIDAATGLQFKQPPIRQVTLTLHFSSDAPVGPHAVAPLSQRWGHDYPVVTERPPLPGREDAGPVSFLSHSEAWPMPYTTYQGSDRALSFQGDRFEVTWSFHDAGNPSYPGFEELLAGMRTSFSDFSDTLAKHQIGLQIQAVECYYVNEIASVTAGELAVGILTGWNMAPPEVERAEQYVGVRLQREASEESPYSSLVMVDSNQDGDPLLALRLSRGVDLQHGNAFDALQEVHEELVAQFLIHTSEEMHRQWGKTS